LRETCFAPVEAHGVEARGCRGGAWPLGRRATASGRVRAPAWRRAAAGKTRPRGEAAAAGDARDSRGRSWSPGMRTTVRGFTSCSCMRTRPPGLGFTVAGIRELLLYSYAAAGLREDALVIVIVIREGGNRIRIKKTRVLLSFRDLGLP
jgi:hypothetical protein